MLPKENYACILLLSSWKFCLHRVIDEDALEQALAAAVTCTILAAAGPQRSRVLATLYKVNFLLVLMETNLVTILVSVLFIIFFSCLIFLNYDDSYYYKHNIQN